MAHTRLTSAVVGTTVLDSQHDNTKQYFIVIIVAFSINSFVCLNGILGFGSHYFLFVAKMLCSAKNMKPLNAKSNCVLFFFCTKHHFIE